MKFDEEIFWLTPYWQGDFYGPNGEACALGALDKATGFCDLPIADWAKMVDFYPGFLLEEKYHNILAIIPMLNDGYYHVNGVRRHRDTPGARHVEGNPAVARKVLYRCLVASGLLKEESVKKDTPQLTAV